METANLARSIAAMIVAVVLVVVVAIPIISGINSADDEPVYAQNTGYVYRTAVVTDGSEVSFTYNGTNSYTVNGTQITATGTSWADCDVLVSEGLIIMIRETGALIQSGEFYQSGVMSAGDTVVWSGGTWTYTDISDSNTQHTGSYSTVIYRDDAGAYGMFPVTSSNVTSVNVNPSSAIYGYVRMDATRGPNSINGLIEGTVDSLSLVDGWAYDSTTPTAPAEISGDVTITVNLQSESEYYDTVSSRLNINSGANVANLIAPIQYTETINHPDGAVYNIINVLPVFLVVAILIAAIGLFVNSRR